ncbi:BCCT family transporter [Vibrio parahaemolyticus]|uniref:BCCT family transporter n=1 Tax=Vibrio parahaemolyticus TaxID=670 RepID=UPI001A2AABB0|nr:BCCT family transporter [Vibrio parahaemolyticus]HAS6189707.1 BCCT family transporter [Vibrio vulnificus]
MNSQLRYKVFIPPFLLLITAVLASFFNLEGFLALTTTINNWILDTFDWLFSAGAFFMVITCIAVFFSPLGKVIIGGKDAKPLLSKWRWGSITICTTTAAGMLFWATAEPLFHLYSPPESLGITPGSKEAAEFSLSTMYMHWSFTPFVIYTVPALSFALAFYNLSQRFSISASLQPLFGRRCSQSVGGVVDSISMFALVAGMASSLGTGALVLASGVSNVTGLPNGSILLGTVIALIMICFVASSVSGLQKGIARLSAVNTTIFALIAIIAFIFGPTQTIIVNGANAFADYATEFVSRSLSLNLDAGDDWAKSWTVFYWANWLAWAPIVALFLGKIARGHSVRVFIVVNMIIPASFSLIWMAIFSGMILELDMTQNGMFYNILNESGEGAVVYGLLNQLPGPTILTGLFIFIAFLAYVTAADSNTEAISSLCIEAQGTSEESSPLKSKLKILWGSIIAIIAWFMTAFSGIDGVKMMSNLGGLPALFVVLAMNASLLVWAMKSISQALKQYQARKQLT